MIMVSFLVSILINSNPYSILGQFLTGLMSLQLHLEEDSGYNSQLHSPPSIETCNHLKDALKRIKRLCSSKDSPNEPPVGQYRDFMEHALSLLLSSFDGTQNTFYLLPYIGKFFPYSLRSYCVKQEITAQSSHSGCIPHLQSQIQSTFSEHPFNPAYYAGCEVHLRMVNQLVQSHFCKTVHSLFNSSQHAGLVLTFGQFYGVLKALRMVSLFFASS